MVNQTRKHTLHNTRLMTMVLTLGLTIPAATAMAFFGGFSGIVFDPSNYVENLRQAAALLQQVERATTQIRLQRRVLADLPSSIASALLNSGSGLHQQLAAGITEFDGGLTGDGIALNTRYPIELSDLEPAWLDTRRLLWTAAERASLAREREFAAHVRQGMATSTERLAVSIEASNGIGRSSNERPGQRATLQAQEELLALCYGELNKLLGLRILRARRNMTDSARLQATVAYQTERRRGLMNDWSAELGHSQSVNVPFGRK